MPCIPSLFQPGGRRGERRWRPVLARTKRRSKARRDKLPKERGVPRRRHAWESQPQVLHRLRTVNAEASVAFGHTHEEETGVTSGIAKRRLSPIVEGNEVAGVSSSAAAAICAFFFRARRRAAPAAPAEVPNASKEQGCGKDRDEGLDRDGGGVLSKEGRGKEEDEEEGRGVEASSVAESVVALQAISQAFRAAPTAPAELSNAGMERGHDKKEGREQEEEAEEERVAGVEEIPKEGEEEYARESSVPASAALTPMFQACSAAPADATELPSAGIKQGNENDGRGEEGREEEEKKEAEEDTVVGAEGMGKEEQKAEEVVEMELSSADAVGARASIVRASTSVNNDAASAASGAGVPIANIQRGNQEGGKREEDREREEERKLKKTAADTSVANPGHAKVQYGSPVPAEFRPEGHEDDVLCKWGFDCFDKKAGQRLLGSGAFGSVYRVRTKIGRPIAKKVLNTPNPTEKRYAKNEVDIAQACSVHPCIVDVFGVIRTPTQINLLMPEVPCNLAGLIKHLRTEHIRLDESQAINIIRQLMSALEFLHGLDIIHRDIKPANILLRGSEIYLADFGLAITAPDGIPSIGNECGTLPYMAPEIFAGQVYGSGVDVWAVAVTLYELFHLQLPFTDKPDLEWDNGGGGGRAVELRGGRGNMSESSGSIVTGCTKSQENLKANIVRGDYRMDTKLAGDSCRDFISQLFSSDPRRRPTAVQAGEHPWLNADSTIQRRRRTTRLAIATNTAGRAISAVQRLQARVQPSPNLAGAAAAVVGSSAVLKAKEAAASAVAELDQVVVMLHRVVAMGEDVKVSEEQAAAQGAKDSCQERQTAFRMEENIVRTIEMYAREAQTAVAAVTVAVDSWEKVVRQSSLPPGLSRVRRKQ